MHRILRRRVMVPVAASLLVCALLPPAPSRTARADVASPPASELAIQIEDLRRRLEHLTTEAMEGRETATQGARLAGAFIAAEMERIGLQPAGTAGYFQGFPVARPRLGKDNALEVRTGGATDTFEVEQGWNPFSLSRSGEAEGDLVVAGYGITAPKRTWKDADGRSIEGWDDYAGVDVAGKVVLVLRKDPGWNDPRHASFRAKLENAATHGAAALLLVNDRASARGGDAITHWSAPVGGRPGAGAIPYAFVKRKTALRLAGLAETDLETYERTLREHGPRAESFEGRHVHMAVDLDTRSKVEGRNVVGLLRGTDPAKASEVLVVGAHYDHVGRGNFGSRGGAKAAGTVHPGADDNASGTAALLEVAECLTDPAHRPARSIYFVAFSGEEIGLYGSRHFVAHPPVPLGQIVLMANLDMVGRSRGRKVRVGGVGTAGGLEDVLLGANEGIGLDVTTWASGNAPADSVVFFRKKIPVLFFFTGLHDDYHRPTDTPDKIAYPAFADITRLVARTVTSVADADARLLYVDPPRRKAPPWIGVQLAQGSHANGVEVAAVTKKGPAADAGVRAGDVVVGLTDHQIKSAADLMQVIRGLEAGASVSIDVLRGDERMRFELVPRKRGR